MFQIFENLFSDPNHFQVLAIFRKQFFLCFLLKDFKKCVLPYVISKLKSEIFHRKGIKFQQKKDLATTARGYRRDKRRGAVEWLFWENVRFICLLKIQLLNLFVFFICQAIYIFFILQLFRDEKFSRFSKYKPHQSKCENFRMVQVIYQTRETLLHRDIQTPRREMKTRHAAEYF